MKRVRLIDVRPMLATRFAPQLNVIEYISTHREDAERGPMVRMRGSDARKRLVQEGELVWVAGPRRKEIAVLEIDDSIPEGKVALRDVAGVAVSEAVTVIKPDTDVPPRDRHFG